MKMKAAENSALKSTAHVQIPDRSMETTSHGDTETVTSCCDTVRRSRHMVTFIVFSLFFMDNLFLTSVEPVLPDIIENSNGIPDFLLKEVEVVNATLDVNNDEGMNKTTGAMEKEQKALAVGFVFAVKPLIEFILNPFVGFIVDRIGYQKPLYLGYVISFVSAVSFALTNNYSLLFISRLFQGIGNCLFILSSITLIPKVNPGLEDRTKAMAIAFSGGAVGALLGLPFGSAVYQLLGREYPYIILAIVIFLLFVLQFFYIPPKSMKSQNENTTVFTVFKPCIDPYIVATAALYIGAFYTLGAMFFSIPVYVHDEFPHVEQYQIGILQCISVLPLIITQVVLSKFAFKIGWLKLCFFGGLILNVFFIATPFVPSFWLIALPMCVGAGGLGMFLSSYHALLSYIADIRLGSLYGSVFGFNKMAQAVGMFSGSLLTSVFMDSIGFMYAFLVNAAITFPLWFLCILLRNIPKKHSNTHDEHLDMSVQSPDPTVQTHPTCDNKEHRTDGDEVDTKHTSPGTINKSFDLNE